MRIFFLQVAEVVLVHYKVFNYLLQNKLITKPKSAYNSRPGNMYVTLAFRYGLGGYLGHCDSFLGLGMTNLKLEYIYSGLTVKFEVFV